MIQPTTPLPPRIVVELQQQNEISRFLMPDGSAIVAFGNKWGIEGGIPYTIAAELLPSATAYTECTQ